MPRGRMNAPLWVTWSRILAIPPLMVLVLDDGIPGGRWWAFGLFSLACVTDSLDGWLARSRGEVTVVGTFLDSLADKLLVAAVLVCLIEAGEIAAWVAMVIIAREMAVTGLRLVAASEDVIIPASRFGKAKAFSQDIALAVIVAPAVFSPVAEDALLGVAIAMTVLSGAYYFLIARRRLFPNKEPAMELLRDS